MTFRHLLLCLRVLLLHCRLVATEDWLQPGEERPDDGVAAGAAVLCVSLNRDG